MKDILATPDDLTQQQKVDLYAINNEFVRREKNERTKGHDNQRVN